MTIVEDIYTAIAEYSMAHLRAKPGHILMHPDTLQDIRLNPEHSAYVFVATSVPHATMIWGIPVREDIGLVRGAYLLVAD